MERKSEFSCPLLGADGIIILGAYPTRYIIQVRTRRRRRRRRRVVMRSEPMVVLRKDEQSQPQYDNSEVQNN